MRRSLRPEVLRVLAQSGPIGLDELDVILRRQSGRLLPGEVTERAVASLVAVGLVEIDVLMTVRLTDSGRTAIG
jgi:hypothetical protein